MSDFDIVNVGDKIRVTTAHQGVVSEKTTHGVHLNDGDFFFTSEPWGLKAGVTRRVEVLERASVKPKVGDKLAENTVLTDGMVIRSKYNAVRQRIAGQWYAIGHAAPTDDARIHANLRQGVEYTVLYVIDSDD